MTGINFGTQGRKTIADIVDQNAATAKSNTAAASGAFSDAYAALDFGLQASAKKAQVVPTILQNGQQSVMPAMVNMATEQMQKTKQLVDLLSGLGVPVQATAASQGK